ncbi:MAG TPA: thiamine-phosphate kinase [Rhodanobacteraceae bacterium]|nr:thiamine-phosphate kinase [Rhodanobacteraceae bacterium]
MDEFDLIDLIRARSATLRGDVRLGIGDDGAVLAPPAGQELVACTDTLVGGVHFPTATAASDIGWKALAVNLSDLAAMGATPAWALLALTLPHAERAFLEEFLDGFFELAATCRVALVGGDTARGPLSASVTALGFVPPGLALRRDGARPGDLVYVTGSLGDAAAGLHCLAQEAGPVVSAAHRAALVARLHRPQPRLAAGAALRGAASACIDVSDGLLADLGHVATASGVAIEVEAAALPTSPALLAFPDAAIRLGWQLGGGDDYELAFAVPPARRDDAIADLARLGCGAAHIGKVVAGSGVRAFGADGAEVVPDGRGWRHFA